MNVATSTQTIKTSGETMITWAFAASGVNIASTEIKAFGAVVETVSEERSRPDAIKLAMILARAMRRQNAAPRAEKVEALIGQAQRRFNLEAGAIRPSASKASAAIKNEHVIASPSKVRVMWASLAHGLTVTPEAAKEIAGLDEKATKAFGDSVANKLTYTLVAAVRQSSKADPSIQQGFIVSAFVGNAQKMLDSQKGKPDAVAKCLATVSANRNLFTSRPAQFMPA